MPFGRIGKGGHRVDKNGRFLTHKRKWKGWYDNTICDNCGRTRDDARIYQCCISRIQWEWLDGEKEPTRRTLNKPITADKTIPTKFVKICEVCAAFLKERGPYNEKTKIG